MGFRIFEKDHPGQVFQNKKFLTQGRMLVEALRSHVIQKYMKNSTKKVQAKE